MLLVLYIVCNQRKSRMTIFKEETVILPGHLSRLHCLLSVSVPGHGRPPLAGAGSEQYLYLSWYPSPQVTVQGCQADQRVQLPLTNI